MSAFVPVHRVPKSRQAYVVRKRKRKQASDSDENNQSDAGSDRVSAHRTRSSGSPNNGPRHSADSDDETASAQDRRRLAQAINRQDPYYIAGHPRSAPLPQSRTFPHAALPDPSQPFTKQPSTATLEARLAELRLFPPKEIISEQTTSAKARHVNNLTALLHQCMLNGDWGRANRIWGILLRIEIAGVGMDVRRHGRWTIGAELLMRRPAQAAATRDEHSSRTPSASNDGEADDGSTQSVHATRPCLDPNEEITDEGFQLARAYYERLILQYPHTSRTQHSVTNARVIYPALFNIWVYEVQNRAKRARRQIAESNGRSHRRDTSDVTGSLASSASPPSSPPLDRRNNSKTSVGELLAIYIRELDEADSIATRLDDLMLNPPYDSSAYLRRLRGMIALWRADLHETVAQGLRRRGSSASTSDDDGRVQSDSFLELGEGQGASVAQHLTQATDEMAKAENILGKEYIAREHASRSFGPGLITGLHDRGESYDEGDEDEAHDSEDETPAEDASESGSEILDRDEDGVSSAGE